MTRPVRIILIAAAAVIVVAAGTAAIAFASFNPDSYKPDIIAAVKRATGRDLVLTGTISLKLSLQPTIQVADVALSNPPGFSRPQMATLQGLEVQFSLLPLLSSQFQINRLLLIHPDILLETDAGGQPNWRLTPQVSATAPPGSQAPTPSGKAKPAVSVNAIRIQGGTLAYRDDRIGKVTTIGLPELDASADGPDAPMHLETDASYDGTAFNLTADTGSLSRLQDPAATSAWPAKVTLTLTDTTLSADGTLTRPLEGKGYDVAVNGRIPNMAAPNLATLTPLLRDAPASLQQIAALPLHDVTFAARIADKGGQLPDVSTLTLHVGASDLGARIPGLMLAKLDVSAPAADQPLTASATGQFAKAPLSLAATLGAPALLMPGAKPAPFPVDVTLQAAGAIIAGKGSVVDAQALTGVNIVLTAEIPDLSALAPLARQGLPALKQIVFQGTASEPAGGLRNGVMLHAIKLTSPDGDVSGDVSIDLHPRTSLTATLKSTRIDLDAINATPTPGAPPPSADAPSPPARRNDRLFSDQPIPFDQLRGTDADIHLDIGTLHASGADTKAITFHAGLKDARLSIEPFAADLPGGHLSGSVSVDASKSSPPVHVVLHAPGLALKAILAAIRQPAIATGNLEVYADLSGDGATPHALAASLDGSLGLSVAGGTIDNRILGSVLGKVLQSLNVLDLVGKGGSSELRCFAARMEARHGTGMVQPLVLNSSLLTATGGGTVNLANETLDMTLRPQVKVAGTNLVVPVKLSGPIVNPVVAVNRLGTAESNVGTVAGAVIGDATPIGILGGLLGADKLLGGNAGDICPAALAVARGQPVPAQATATPTKTNEPSVSNPEAALKNLFR